MKIVGINSGFDGQMRAVSGGAAALIVDGAIHGAISEERVSRRRFEGGYRGGLRVLLDDARLSREDVDFYYLSFYGSPLFPRRDLIQHHIDDLGLSVHPEKLVVVTSHHLSHAALAFFLSPFEEAAIMVADNEGSLLSRGGEDSDAAALWCERNTYYWAKGNQIEFLDRDFARPWELGFGKAYNKFTRYVGFGDYHHAGKTMGLCGYGTVPESWSGANIWEEDADGRLRPRMQDTNDFSKDVPKFFKDHDIAIPPPGDGNSYKEKDYQILAAFVQEQLNFWSTVRCKRLLEQVGVRNLCVSGGVGLNSIMNYHLESTLGIRVFVPPFPSDEGQALGNAILGLVREGGYLRGIPQPLRFANWTYLGPTHRDEAFKAAVSAAADYGTVERLEQGELSDERRLSLLKGRSSGGIKDEANTVPVLSETGAFSRMRDTRV